MSAGRYIASSRARSRSCPRRSGAPGRRAARRSCCRTPRRAAALRASSPARSPRAADRRVERARTRGPKYTSRACAGGVVRGHGRGGRARCVARRRARDDAHVHRSRPSPRRSGSRIAARAPRRTTSREQRRGAVSGGGRQRQLRIRAGIAQVDASARSDGGRRRSLPRAARRAFRLRARRTPRRAPRVETSSRRLKVRT